MIVDPFEAVGADLVAGFEESFRGSGIALQSRGHSENGQRYFQVLHEPQDPPDAGPGAILVDLLHAHMPCTGNGRGVDDLRQEGLCPLVPVQNAVFAAFFIVEDDLNGDPGAAWPVGLGWRAAIADKIPWVALFAHHSSPKPNLANRHAMRSIVSKHAPICIQLTCVLRTHLEPSPHIALQSRGAHGTHAGALSMAGLTTHILDTANGRPAAGLTLRLYRGAHLVCERTTNSDGRCDDPLLSPDEAEAGTYRLEFEVGPYFRSLGQSLPEPAFLETVPVVFGIADPSAHYHVPLLVSPYGYSTYRGS